MGEEQCPSIWMKVFNEFWMSIVSMWKQAAVDLFLLSIHHIREDNVVTLSRSPCGFVVGVAFVIPDRQGALVVWIELEHCCLTSPSPSTILIFTV